MERHRRLTVWYVYLIIISKENILHFYTDMLEIVASASTPLRPLAATKLNRNKKQTKNQASAKPSVTNIILNF